MFGAWIVAKTWGKDLLQKKGLSALGAVALYLAQLLALGIHEDDARHLATMTQRNCAEHG